jgi:transcriptional regulator GlxA family with amidase domain
VRRRLLLLSLFLGCWGFSKLSPYLQETAARFRIERAARLLRETDESYASIAADAGFCDQSHMNRTFRRLLGRAPSAVRGDRLLLRRIEA